MLKIFYHAEMSTKMQDVYISFSFVSENGEKLFMQHPGNSWFLMEHRELLFEEDLDKGYSEKYDCEIIAPKSPGRQDLGVIEWLKRINPENEKLIFVTDAPYKSFYLLSRILTEDPDIMNLVQTCIDISTIKGIIEMSDESASGDKLPEYIAKMQDFHNIKYALDDIPLEYMDRYAGRLYPMLHAIAYQYIYNELEDVTIE